ncbi:unnamed protein product, partial [marine sediment metagenome]
GLEFSLVFVPGLNANFNFGEHEALRFADVTRSLAIDTDPESEEESFLREYLFELGIDAPDPEGNYESNPTLIKMIIQKRNREKTPAERKRLFYVAATRAMDHLILVGRLKSRGVLAKIEDRARSINEIIKWIYWLSKIMNLIELLNSESSTVLLGDTKGEHIEIPYHLFNESQASLSL